MIGSGVTLVDVSSVLMIMVAKEVLCRSTIVGVDVGVIMLDVGMVVGIASEEEGGSTISLPIDVVVTICKELSDTVDVSAEVITVEIIGCEVGTTEFSIVVVVVKELTELDAITIGMLVSVPESERSLLVVEEVKAEIVGPAVGVNMATGDVGEGVALLMKVLKEVGITVSKTTGNDSVGFSDAVVSVVVGDADKEVSTVVLITDEICSML